MTIDRSDAVPIAILAAAAVSACAANLLLHADPARIGLPFIGIIAYAALVRIGDVDRHLLCDTIQSGESAVGTMALYAGALFFTANTSLLLAITVAALILYQAFMKAALAPLRKEIALSGIAVQAVLAVIALFVVIGGPGLRIPSARSVCTGYFSAVPVPAALAAVCLALAVIIPVLLLALTPEMRLLSHGVPFTGGRPLRRTAAAAGLTVARGVLAAISLLFAGWTCAVGVGVRRLHRGALPDPVMAFSLAALVQAAVLVEILAGPLQAAAASWVISYAVFFLYHSRRVHLYDRYQQS